MTPRPWLARDVEILRQNWLKRPTPEIALMLGRSVSAIRNAAQKFGFCRKIFLTPEQLAQVRSWHSEGLSDGEIGKRLGKKQHTICRVRQKLGLPAHFRRGQIPARSIKRMVDKQESKARSMGFSGWIEFMNSRRRLACDSEFPGCIAPRQVAVCRLLLVKGPLGHFDILGLLRDQISLSVVRRAIKELLDYDMIQEQDGRYSLTPRARAAGASRQERA